MRVWSVFRKSLREQRRGLWVLIMTLVTAPFFVFLYWAMFGGGSATYSVLMLSNDVPVQVVDGRVLSGFVAARGIGCPSGDAGRRPGQPQYAVAGVMASAAIDAYVQAATGQKRAVQFAEIPLGASGARKEFESYVPGLLIFAAVMVIYPASMVVTREVEAGTLRRLRLARMTSLDFLGGVSFMQVLIAVVSVFLTFLTAWVLGFRSQGPVWVAIAISALTSLSMIGAGLLVASFSRTVIEAFVIGTFPMFLFFFFTGAAFPLPKVALFTIGGHTVGLQDVLAPTHAVVALNKVLSLGAGLGTVAFELIALLVLSLLYFAIGVWVFQRRHLRAQ